MLEKLIAYHCAPALAGIKVSNMFACYKDKYPNAKDEIVLLNYELNKKNIYIEIICECEKRLLLIVYRKNKLQEQLRRNNVTTFLNSYGYSGCTSISDYLNVLKERLKNKEFPHEIGVFLGYPIEDIYGFLYHKEEGCLLVGEWRVYSDEENAKIMFLRFRKCRAALLKRVNDGNTLAQIFCAA